MTYHPYSRNEYRVKDTHLQDYDEGCVQMPVNMSFLKADLATLMIISDCADCYVFSQGLFCGGSPILTASSRSIDISRSLFIASDLSIVCCVKNLQAVPVTRRW